MKTGIALLSTMGVICAAAMAGDREDYNRRAAERDMAMFQELDRNQDHVLSMAEVKGALSLESRFNDIDIDRDGDITLEEMTRYIDRTYGVAVSGK